MASRLSSMAAMSFDEMRSTMDADRIDAGVPALEGGLPAPFRAMLDGGGDRRPSHPRPDPRSSSVHRAEFRGAGDDYEDLLRLDEDVVKRGLSLGAIRALPRRTVRDGECVEDPVARCPCKPGTVVYDLPCGHVLAKASALGWFKDHRTCPVCRREIEA